LNVLCKQTSYGIKSVYRSSKLTHLLKNALGGNSKTSFIANLWDDVDQQQESVSTCRFAQRIAQLETHVEVNVVSLDQTAMIQQYEKEVHSLRAEVVQLQSKASSSAAEADSVEPEQVRDKVQQPTMWNATETKEARVKATGTTGMSRCRCCSCFKHAQKSKPSSSYLRSTVCTRLMLRSLLLDSASKLSSRVLDRLLMLVPLPMELPYLRQIVQVLSGQSEQDEVLGAP
jgi:hypothetical protein